MTNKVEKIIKMPKDVWNGLAGVSTSIFIFRTQTPHSNKDIIKYWIKDDELITIKNGGRQDINDKWADNGKNNLLKYWSDIINNVRRHETKQVSKEFEYIVPKQEILLTETDFEKVVLERILFENEIIKDNLMGIGERNLLLWAINNGKGKNKK